MTLKVHISPTAAQVRDTDGVGKVVLAQHKYLAEQDIEITSADRADVIAAHITADGLPRVDCLHSHGIYWTGDVGSGTYSKWHSDINGRIFAAARQAKAITVPSEWVSQAFLRDMRLRPAIIGHGVEIDEWEPAEHRGYVLWNKGRATDSCSPVPAAELATRGVDVVSTFAPPNSTPPPSLRVVGMQPHDRMRLLVRHAEAYLATTKETFGIGTLEAMAAGIPVLGYAYGGTADLVTHQETGYLVQPGDYDGLMDGLDYIRRHRRRLGAAAREQARRYDWRNVAAQYAALYRRVAEPEPSGIAVVISNYNYGSYIDECIQSVINQSETVEIIVVDDGSTDNSRTSLREWERRGYIRLLTQENAGVAAARNAGISATDAPFIVCLDADDKLDPAFCATLAAALKNDRSLGIAYTGLSLWHPDGSLSENQWPPEFSWESQSEPHTPPSNCIPSAAMFRRSMWERAGGYKQVYAPGEDAEFWTRGLSVGFTAKRVTPEGLFHYRVGHQSASRSKSYTAIDAWHPWMRDKQYPMAAPARTQPLVRSYSEPVVSVVIPVGPGHARYLPAALDSLLGQTFRDWECVVINDSGGELHLTAYSFVRVVDIGQANGVAEARNEGLDRVRAPLVVFLDADDYLMPTALDAMLRAHVANDGRYIYTDWIAVNGETQEARQSPDWTRDGWLQTGQHAVTALIPTAWARDVGGFDVTLPGWEEWDFYIKLTIAGYCGVRVPEPLLAYRQHTGGRRAESFDRADATKAILRERYGDYVTGEREMGGCCGGNGDALIKVKQALGEGDMVSSLTLAGDLPPGDARMEYIGRETGAITFFGKAGRQYRGANNAHDRYADVDSADVERLVLSGKWRLVIRPRPVPEPVAIESVVEPKPSADLVPAGFEDDDDPAVAAAVEAANTASAAHSAKRRKK